MPLSRDAVFDRVLADYLVRGVTRVVWTLRPVMRDGGPYLFQLQANRNGGAPGHWEDVGSPVEDAFYALDSEQRLCGKDHRLVYRVVLTTAAAAYASPHAHVMGDLNFRQWAIAREMIRRILAPLATRDIHRGYLLKRKVVGEPCADCTDAYTGAVTDTDCEACYGTGITGGYWRAAAHTLANITPERRHTHTDQSGRGTVNPVQHMSAFVGLPVVNSRDAWVSQHGDKRYIVHSVSNQAEVDGVPVIQGAELRLLEQSNVLYSFDVEDGLPARYENESRPLSIHAAGDAASDG